VGGGNWVSLEGFITREHGIGISHGISLTCHEKFLTEFRENAKSRDEAWLRQLLYEAVPTIIDSLRSRIETPIKRSPQRNDHVMFRAWKSCPRQTQCLHVVSAGHFTSILDIGVARAYRDAFEFDAPTTFERESKPWQRFHDDVFNAASLLQIPTHAIAASRSSKNATLHDPAAATFMKCLVNLSG